MSDQNPLQLDGIDFIEFSSPNPENLHKLFLAFGFTKVMTHKQKQIDYYRQGDVHFFLNKEPGSFATDFYEKHGPCVSSMGWRVKNGEKALEVGVSRGAKAASQADYERNGEKIPAIWGIGESLIYFIEDYENPNRFKDFGFEDIPDAKPQPGLGFLNVDHLTNNVYKGTMEQWSNFYKDVFGFTEVRYFDIRGAKTGLVSYALRSPCGKFCIPINEGTEKKSQINEYLDEYKGPGVQHIALTTNDIVKTLENLSKTDIETLDIDDEYYDEVFDRVPNVTEDRQKLRDFNILVDGDEEGYLLQIFTKNIIGPIFIEIIQRKNHFAFGEGNFGALFRSIEKDQERRGFLD